MQVLWFRRDLRVADHPALTTAVAEGPVACVFVVDPNILGRRHHACEARRAFLADGLRALDSELRARGSGLFVLRGEPADVLTKFAHAQGAARVLALRETSPLGRARDRRVADAMKEVGIELSLERGDLVVEPENLPGSSGEGYRVFTPFSKAWFELPLPVHIPAPERLSGPTVPAIDLDDLSRSESTVPAGPVAARERLVAFVSTGDADRYGEGRDDLAADATSHLSMYLRFGMTSAGAIGRALGLPGDLSPGRNAFWRQIAWREFAQHLMFRRPEVARAAMRPDLRRVAWEDDPEGFTAWCDGRTGYPLVDAGMRQLTEANWVHNRARMVVASFLVKDLMIDWRRGETFFMQHLLDGDPAANNFGWQWTAGTGADAAPYFRIFNPVRQSQRFDPAGEYIRRWVPELRGVEGKAIHQPWTMSDAEQQASGCAIGRDYPAPIVEHAFARERALERYSAARAAAGD